MDVELEYCDEDFVTLINYKAFSQHIRPLVAAENPKVAVAKVMCLVAAKWREFVELHPNKEVLQLGSAPASAAVAKRARELGEWGAWGVT